MHSELMKKLLPLLFILPAFVSNAQRTLFSRQNNYVAPVAPPTVPTNNLILNLNASTYSGSGTTWNDASSQNNTATLVGSPTYTSSPASFTFGPNIIATTTKSNVALSAATFVAWINPSQTQGGYTGVIFSRNGFGGSTVPATGLDLYTSNSVGYHWADNVSTYNWNSNLYVPNNEWSMIAVTVSATTATAYLCNLSGIVTASNSVTHANLSGLNFFIACDPSDRSTRAFTGKMGTAMVYSNALTQTDISNIFNAQKSAFGL
jgi:hypothetical protein